MNSLSDMNYLNEHEMKSTDYNTKFPHFTSEEPNAIRIEREEFCEEVFKNHATLKEDLFLETDKEIDLFKIRPHLIIKQYKMKNLGCENFELFKMKEPKIAQRSNRSAFENLRIDYEEPVEPEKYLITEKVQRRRPGYVTDDEMSWKDYKRDPDNPDLRKNNCNNPENHTNQMILRAAQEHAQKNNQESKQVVKEPNETKDQESKEIKTNLIVKNPECEQEAKKRVRYGFEKRKDDHSW